MKMSGRGPVMAALSAAMDAELRRASDQFEALRASLEGAGLGVEVMNSPAACRTYNVLLSEGRRVALAVLPV